ncbi:MAG: hypothetical protein DWG80_01585 [Chloroflexi bacterium]|nr:hypothetical protein [Chloroflexota bacterium]
MKLPDDLMHPSGGEQLDDLAHGAIKLAHEAIERFPDMKKRHMFLAGGAAISSALVVAAGVAVARRIRAGAKPHEAVRDVTEEEIEGLRLVERSPYRPNGATPAATTDEVPEDVETTPDDDPGTPAIDGTAAGS